MASTRRGVVVAVAAWLRSYLALVLLVALVASAAVRALLGVVVPSPEFPPVGYHVVRDTVELEWSLSSETAKTRLEVSADDPSFGGEKAIDEEIVGKKFTLSELEPGTTYFWRVSEGGRLSSVSYFYVAQDALRY
jgi:hypothetical protein